MDPNIEEETSDAEAETRPNSDLALLESLVIGRSLGPTLMAYFGAASKAAGLRYIADQEFAQALIAADGKNEAVRKAQAELAAGPAILAASFAEVNAAAFRHLVIHLRGDAGRAEVEGP